MFRYNYTNKGLLNPESISPFKGAKTIPSFSEGETEFSNNNAWWLANFSHLAYFEDAPLVQRLAKLDYALVRQYKHESTYAFLAKKGDHLILAFRGTETPHFKDYWTDLDIRSFSHQDNFSLHNGFQAAYSQIAEEILGDLENRKETLWYTGHSLGAALATIFAYKKPPFGCYTFGSPRVGCAKFQKSFSQKCSNTWRVVNCSDIVNSLPPPVNFKHVGNQVFITACHKTIHSPDNLILSKYRSKAGFKYFITFRRLVPGNIWVRSLADHSIVNYSNTLGKIITQEDKI